MSQRLKKLPANQLTTRVSALQSQIEEQKAEQIAGSHNVVLVETSTGNSYDFSPTVAPNTVQQWKATFVPASNILPNTGFIWHAFFHVIGSYSNTQFGGDQDPSDPRSYYLTVVGLNGSTTDSFQVQVYMYTIGAGTITIEKTI